ncbi:hypothetical protein SAMN02744133_11642 [Thalassospira xiamenensis M-5 = DSM 17429]|uniref:Glyoxalase-related protein domain-containing protein n=1 Tax=Thalassospira xiamenensis M-5 = DSM 17429 TaxID=1123366 RepID=A0AB72U9F6_9PROT|nr:glyoxalase superfamily protein [Thalassospira xiamenensis]AJD50841.1 hypothetical protein TH3_03585 [Thalassospira xiamenensis M-5 = DSM 17429]SIT29908.1 hypothetical protein SAMN02744133_11642 [Thalassospira xiamenensis M-5 = DSM 17429]
MTQPVHNPPEKPERTPVELADFAKIASGDPAEMLKQQAKRLRKALASRKMTVSHTGSLELLAQSHGFRDWNTAIAMTRKREPVRIADLGIGKRFAGSYLGHAVCGQIRGVTRTPVGGVYRIEVHLDQPVDVVTSERFSALRQRIASRINEDCEPVLANGTRGPGLSVDLLL